MVAAGRRAVNSKQTSGLGSGKSLEVEKLKIEGVRDWVVRGHR